MKKKLTSDELQILEAIDGIHRLGILVKDVRDMSSLIDQKISNTKYVTYQDIIDAINLLKRRGYIDGVRLSELGLSVTKGICNPRLMYQDGTVYREAVRR